MEDRRVLEDGDKVRSKSRHLGDHNSSKCISQAEITVVDGEPQSIRCDVEYLNVNPFHIKILCKLPLCSLNYENQKSQ